MKKKCSLKNNLKKIILIVVTCALMSALLCFPVSAVDVGGATIRLIGGSFFAAGTTVSSDNVSYSNNDDGQSWDATMSLINPISYSALWESSALFTFSSANNNGTLSVTIDTYGTLNQNTYTGFYGYNDNGSYSKLSTKIIYDTTNNKVILYYSGVVPSRFKVVTYATYAGTAATLVNDYYYFNFTPGTSFDTQSIIDNQNENTDKIISAQQEATESQTDEILNGWDTDAAPDEDTTSDFSDIEGALINDTQSDSEEASSEVNDNFLGSLQRYVSGFSAVSQMFSDMLLVQMPDFNGIVWFSLAMGVVPLIVGLSVQGLRANDARNARSARQAAGRKKGV